MPWAHTRRSQWARIHAKEHDTRKAEHFGYYGVRTVMTRPSQVCAKAAFSGLQQQHNERRFYWPSLILLWLQWTWTFCRAPGIHLRKCFQLPSSAYLLLPGSRRWAWRFPERPGYGAAKVRLVYELVIFRTSYFLFSFMLRHFKWRQETELFYKIKRENI